MVNTSITENALAKVDDEALIEEYEGRNVVGLSLELGPEWDEDAFQELVIREMAARFEEAHSGDD